jgi:hypothetical protein
MLPFEVGRQETVLLAYQCTDLAVRAPEGQVDPHVNKRTLLEGHLRNDETRFQPLPPDHVPIAGQLYAVCVFSNDSPVGLGKMRIEPTTHAFGRRALPAQSLPPTEGLQSSTFH